MHAETAGGLRVMADRFHPSCAGHAALAKLAHDRIVDWFVYTAATIASVQQ